MITLNYDVQELCLTIIGVLLIYTLWLIRSGRLSSHVGVTWVLTEIMAFVLLLLWKWMPFFGITSKLGDRELFMILAVGFFAFVVFLMLDSLSRVSKQAQQIKLLTQELALLRQRVEKND